MMCIITKYRQERSFTITGQCAEVEGHGNGMSRPEHGIIRDDRKGRMGWVASHVRQKARVMLRGYVDG